MTHRNNFISLEIAHSFLGIIILGIMNSFPLITKVTVNIPKKLSLSFFFIHIKLISKNKSLTSKATYNTYTIRTTHTNKKHIIIHSHNHPPTYSRMCRMCGRDTCMNETGLFLVVRAKGMGIAGRAIQQINTSGGDRQPVSLPPSPRLPLHPSRPGDRTPPPTLSNGIEYCKTFRDPIVLKIGISIVRASYCYSRGMKSFRKDQVIDYTYIYSRP